MLRLPGAIAPTGRSLPAVTTPSSRLRRTVAFVVAVVAVVLGACGGSSNATDSPSGAASGSSSGAALGWTAPLLGGGRFDSASYAGKPVAFWFWAPT